MDISIAAIMSIVALAIVVIISCINEDLHVGFLSIGLAIIVGGVWGIDANSAHRDGGLFSKRTSIWRLGAVDFALYRRLFMAFTE